MMRKHFRKFGKAFQRFYKYLLPKTKEYLIGRYKIKLSRDHRLPLYQAKHPLYDRFLPVLCENLNSRTGLIVDVGANVGDTTAAMFQMCPNPMLCIEGDKEFFHLLLENIERLGADTNRIKVANVLVGTGTFTGGLVSSGTTATRSTEVLGTSSVSLDDVLRDTLTSICMQLRC